MTLSFVINSKQRTTGKAKGAYSYYIKLSTKQGIKILYNKTLFLNISDLKQSGLWKGAVKEYNLLNKLADSNLCPKPIEVIPVFCETTQSYYPGLKMEHISGQALSWHLSQNPNYSFKLNDSNYLAHELQRYLENKIQSYGIKHRDLHFGNILISKSGVVKVIDFGLAHKLK